VLSVFVTECGGGVFAGVVEASREEGKAAGWDLLRVFIKFGTWGWKYPSVRSHVRVAGGVGLMEAFGRMGGS
jgi:hypothetical protein